MRWCLLGVLICGSACRNGDPSHARDTTPDKPVPATRPTTTRPAPDELWHRPRSDERQAERDRMVKYHLAARDVSDPAVLEAMRNVPRHWFVPAYQQ